MPRSLRPKECQVPTETDEETELQLSRLFFRRVPGYLGGFRCMDHPALQDPRVRRVFHYGTPTPVVKPRFPREGRV